MSGIFGGTGGKGQNAFQLTGGGTNAPWNWGVSPFDQSLIDQATGSNQTAMENRYNQLGLGGSTMEKQDVAGAGEMGTAITGQLQTQNEANPALNPAMQPDINAIIGNLGTTGSTGLSSLASSALSGAGGASGLSSLLGGGSAAAGGGDLIGDAALGASILG